MDHSVCSPCKPKCFHIWAELFILVLVELEGYAPVMMQASLFPLVVWMPLDKLMRD